ncbi:MAG: zinc-ribbon domain-containing protein, partial [Anaeroplasmataceae bacterium]|nr:zinc-ribbon domain-containing protein [Anaeroplasmataceae bacterium]
GNENNEEAVFCSKCGSRLSEKIFCSKCGKENDSDAQFCIYCGNKLEETNEVVENAETIVDEKPKKEHGKALEITRLVFKIIFFSLACFILIFNFGVCFGKFLKLPSFNAISMSEEMIFPGDLFGTIDIIKNFEAVEANSGAFHAIMSELVPAIINLAAISTALIGTFVVMLVGGIKAIVAGCNEKKIIDLKKYVVLSLAFLFAGVLIVNLLDLAFSTTAIFKMKIKLSASGLVLTAISMSISFILLQMVYEMVMDIILKKGMNSLIKSILHIVECVLFVVVLFSLAASYISFNFSGLLKIRMSSGLWNTAVNGTIYSQYSNNVSVIYAKTFLSEVRSSWIVALIAELFNIAAIITTLCFFVKRFSNDETNNKKSSLPSGITIVVLSVISLALAIVNVCVVKKTPAILDGISSTFGSGSDAKITIGAGVIVFLIFSLFLLASQIVSKVLVKKED